MKRNWNITKNGKHVLSINNKVVGEIEHLVNTTSKRSKFRIEDNEYIIKKVGQYGDKMVLQDVKSNEILSISNDERQLKKWVLEYNNQTYEFRIIDGTLHEFAIVDKNDTLISYSFKELLDLSTVLVKVDAKVENYFFDFVIWYLFYPLAYFHLGGDIDFKTTMN